MTIEEYRDLSNHWAKEPILNVSELENKNDRTLIYGYDMDRNTFHLYLKDEKFHKVYYNGKEYVQNSIYINTEIDPFVCVPGKRVYPEACDYEFCKLLKSYDVSLNLTSFDDKREHKIFHGELIENLIPCPYITKEKFYSGHTHCPECYENNIMKTDHNIIDDGTKDFYDDKNTFICRDCDYSGKVKNLAHEYFARYQKTQIKK